MNWASGFITIINYASAFPSDNVTDAILLEDNDKLLTESSDSLITE